MLELVVLDIANTLTSKMHAPVQFIVVSIFDKVLFTNSAMLFGGRHD
jgi:hypothetical protein